MMKRGGLAVAGWKVGENAALFRYTRCIPAEAFLIAAFTVLRMLGEEYVVAFEAVLCGRTGH